VPAEGPVAVDHRGLALHHRLEQPGDVLRVILQVGVEDDHVVAVGLGDGCADGGALAHVLGVVNSVQAGVVATAQDLGGAIGAAVVDHDELHVTGVDDRQRLLESLPEPDFLVIDRHQDRKLHRNSLFSANISPSLNRDISRSHNRYSMA